MWHWIHWVIHVVLFFLIFRLMIDRITGLWTRIIYDLIYRLMIWRKGWMIMVDIDNFHKMNANSHKNGDRVLREIGFILRKKGKFKAFRYGGDELAILILRSDKEKALSLAEKIRAAIESKKLGITVTCIVGKLEEKVVQICRFKDQEGRNRVILAE